VSRRAPSIVSVVGVSDSGKTTLITKILPELKKKGKKIAVAKHCPRGFDLDVQGKDSWRFTRAGSQGVYLSSSENEAVMRPKDESMPLLEKLESLFPDFDIVLLEGYNDEQGINKVQIIRREIGGSVLDSADIIAYISDMSIDTDKPVFDPNDISAIVSFIEKQEY